jgi:UrcA family protein
MYTKTTTQTAWSVLGAAAVAFTLFAGPDNVVGKDKMVTDSVRISPQGLDLSQPADAQIFYMRLENAAWTVCTRGTRVGLLPVDDKFKCYQTALAEAVHASNQPLVTQIYLATHRSAPVSVADVDLSSPKGIQVARARVDATARRLCLQVADPRDRSTHANYLACVDATVAAALRQITPATDAGRDTAPTHQ